MRRNTLLRKKAIAVLVSSVFSLYLGEHLLLLSPATSKNPNAVRVSMAKKSGVPFDEREKWQVVNDLRSTGEEWYPTISPSFFMHGKSLNLDGKQILPLGGIAGANIVDCNENGYYATSTTDEYGFNNPLNIWSGQSKFDVVFVGDSFTKGSCVNQEESFVSRVRKQFSGTVNLASTGNGPLVELATIQEYLDGRKLGHVFWMYFEGNDLMDLHDKEIHEPVLVKYLEEERFSQDLRSHQRAINSGLIQNVERALQEKEAAAQRSRTKDFIFDRVGLRNIRVVLGAVKSSFGRSEQVQYSLDLFRRVIERAKRTVERGGGDLVFVYLPGYSRYNDNTPYDNTSGAYLKDDVIQLINSLGIDIIDMDSTFRQLDNPKSLFPFGMSGHYNVEGNSIIADEILHYLGQKNGAATKGRFFGSQSLQTLP
jgi:hypothetical protein